ncbi:MAG: MerR family transcriptional regulator [Anaerovoracaceae bacterium]|nr:MerR family transcriptional regulator [Anaerovoracaceae bacterium]
MDKSRLLTIGQFSRLTDIKRDLLRHYDKIGLLRPSVRDDETGYRYYDVSQLWVADMIYLLRKLDVPLGEIKSMLASADNDEVVDALARVKSRALRMRDYYERVADDIDWYENQNDLLRRAQPDDDVEVIRYEPQTVIYGEETENSDQHMNLEYAIADFHQLFGTFRRHYGFFLDEADVRKGIFRKRGEFLGYERFQIEEVYGEPVFTIPGGEYACQNLEDKGGRMDFSALMRWLGENGREADLYIADEIGLQLLPSEKQSRVFLIRAHLKEE